MQHLVVGGWGEWPLGDKWEWRFRGKKEKGGKLHKKPDKALKLHLFGLNSIKQNSRDTLCHATIPERVRPSILQRLFRVALEIITNLHPPLPHPTSLPPSPPPHLNLPTVNYIIAAEFVDFLHIKSKSLKKRAQKCRQVHAKSSISCWVLLLITNPTPW